MSSNNDINKNMDIIPLSLVYPINSRVYKNVLLIDTEVKDAQLFASSANDDTFPITYSSASTKTKLSALLKTKFPNSIIERIGLVFTSNGGIVKTFLDSKPFFTNGDDGEQSVSPYSENVDFIISVIKEFNVKNIDYLACDTLNYPNWKNYYTVLTKETGVIVGASNDKTGNIKYGGDWVMESTSQNIELIYFTKSIEYYSYLLDAMTFHTVVFKSTLTNAATSGTIYGTGDNTKGQLGIGSTNGPSPNNALTVLTAMVTTNSNITGKTPKYISCGTYHTIVLMTDGTIYGTGNNQYGQLGFVSGNPYTVTSLTAMPNATNKIPKHISCDEYCTVVLMTDGTIYGTGINVNGELGTGDKTNTTSLARMDPNGSVIGTDKKTVKYFSCGKWYTVVLMTDGTVWGTGRNVEGQLGLGTGTDKNTDKISLTRMDSAETVIGPGKKTAKYIACGLYITLVLMTDNTIYGTGKTLYGGLGNGTNTDSITTVLTPMTNINSVFSRIPKYISCGDYHTIVLMEDGTIWGTGYNAYGQLGIGNIVNKNTLTQMIIDPRYIPKNISCGGNYTIVLMTDGSVWGVGSVAYHQLGINNATLDKTVLYDTSITPFYGAMLTNGNIPITNVAGIAGMGVIFDAEPQHHTVVFNTSGTIYGTGYNLYGQLGIATGDITQRTILTTTTNHTIISPPKYISIGKNHTIALMTSGEIWGTGNNWYGQLGTGNTDSKTTLTKMTIPIEFNPKYISCGENYTIVLMNDGNIWGTGYNLYGQLGNYTTDNKLSLTLMINTTGKTPKYVSCGQNHTMVLMTDGTIWGTGRNVEGQLGNYTTDNKLSLTLMINTTGKTPRYVSCGGNHTIVLMTDGTIYGTGLNDKSQLGMGDGDITNKTSLTRMDPNGSVIGTGVGKKTPKYISCGQHHTMVLMTDASGSVYGTGRNIEGQLGLGSTTYSYYTSLTIMVNTSGKIPQNISCGTHHTIVLMTDGTIWGTGYNLYGQLGFVSSVSPYTVTSLTVMKDASNVAITNISYIADMNIVDDTPNSDICFPAGTNILTDQGIVVIETINPDIHTINNKHIVDITKTVSLDKYLVEFEKNALGLNCPTENTRISQKHKIYYNGEMWEAKTFLGKFDNVVKVNYNGEILYNVLMEDHSLMLVNNLVCETLHPDNIIAKLFTKKCKYNDGARDKIYGLLTDFLTKSDHKSYNKIAGLVK